MSDQYNGKKEVEKGELDLFLDAYELATGIRLEITFGTESPDFICIQPNGEKIGVELTKITRDPRDASWEIILEKKEEMDSYEALEEMQRLVDKKEKTRVKWYNKNVEKTILVFQLIDCSIETLKSTLEDLKYEFKDHGFCEIWLADYTGLEAFGDIELFCLFPLKCWGFYKRLWQNQKPYG